MGKAKKKAAPPPPPPEPKLVLSDAGRRLAESLRERLRLRIDDLVEDVRRYDETPGLTADDRAILGTARGVLIGVRVPLIGQRDHLERVLRREPAPAPTPEEPT